MFHVLILLLLLLISCSFVACIAMGEMERQIYVISCSNKRFFYQLDHTLSVFSNSCVLGASLKAWSSWRPSNGASGSSANRVVSESSVASTVGSAPAVPALPVSLPSSLLPMMTLPATNMAAPSNQRPGRVSEKMRTPKTAVIMKLADVLMTLTLVVLEASVRARVNRPHIIPLKMRFKTKKS
jgi:hypothetical protein